MYNFELWSLGWWILRIILVSFIFWLGYVVNFA